MAFLSQWAVHRGIVLFLLKLCGYPAVLRAQEMWLYETANAEQSTGRLKRRVESWQANKVSTVSSFYKFVSKHAHNSQKTKASQNRLVTDANRLL